MIHDIKELNFPSYATLESATAILNDMGDRTITAKLHIDGDIKPDFSYDWEVEFKGERYIHSLRTPQALKDSSSLSSKIDLTFNHWAIFQMKRYYFVELTSTNAGTAFADKYIASLGLNIVDFCLALQNVLNFYLGDKIIVDLNPEKEYSEDKAFMDISYSYIWDVLQKMYEVYGVRWHLSYKDGVYFIKVGYENQEISHVFEYGYNKGLISIERQVQNTDIRNSLLGRGGTENLPKYYFKEAPKDSLYESDPDAIPELQYVNFTELRGKTFRDYVKGWKASRYGGDPMENPTEEYQRGFNDELFDPIEYVKDDVSISKYGLLQGGLENNEDIYPSIQNISLSNIGLVNEIVYAEQILSDDVDDSLAESRIISNVDSIIDTRYILTPDSTALLGILAPEVFIRVEEGYKGSLLFDMALKVQIWDGSTGLYVDAVKDVDYTSDFMRVNIFNLDSGEVVENTINIPSGNYKIRALCEIATLTGSISATFSVENIKLYSSKFLNESEKWRPTFDIWIKNIWQTEKLATETNQQYADRVWTPKLGTDGQEAMVVFSSGWLSNSTDWEFKVVKGGVYYDTSKELNGVPSHWRLTLQKSDAELEATDKYIPNMGMQAVAGDTFFFTGIDMPYQYVLWAEQRLDDWKRNNLEEAKDINPVFVAKFDKIRINTLEDGETTLIANSLIPGSIIKVSDKRFIDSDSIPLFIKSITYNYSSSILPDIEVVLSDKTEVVQNPVQKLQGQVDFISAQISRPEIYLVNQLRKIFDTIYLRKDGIEDVSKSPTSFKSLVKSGDFRAGMIGGKGWGIYRDKNENVVAEFDQVKARQSFESNDITIRKVEYIGGMQVYSAASIVVSLVEEDDLSYKCYFDTKGGTTPNLFKSNDIAYCQIFNFNNEVSKFYKRKVIDVGQNFITLSKSLSNGSGVPTEGDVIIHFGNYTDKNRQYVIIRDVIGGGYDRMLYNLNSVDSSGTEYYFSGKIADSESPRWFVGDKENEYIEWKDGKLNIKGVLEVGSEIGGSTVVDGGLLTSETISLGTDGIAKAGATGIGSDDSSVRIWAGASFEERENAPFKVLQKGDLYAKRGIFSGFLKSGTTYITNDNYKEYFDSDNFLDPTLFWVFDISKCSSCIMLKINNLSIKAILELPSLTVNQSLGGTFTKSELEHLRGFIGARINIYNQGEGNGFFITFCDSSGEMALLQGETQQDPYLNSGEYVQLVCQLGAKYSPTYGKNVEFIYWNPILKGGITAKTTYE